MDIQEALKIMRALANGTNPENGEALEERSVCRQPQTVRSVESGDFGSGSRARAGNEAAAQCVSHLDACRRRAGLRGVAQGDGFQGYRQGARSHDTVDCGEAGEIGEDCAASCAAGIAAEGGLSRVYGFTGNHSHCNASAGSK